MQLSRLASIVLPTVAVVFGACEGNVHDLAVGDCFEDVGIDDGEEVSDVELVDCDQPHDNEVFAVFSVDPVADLDLEEDQYPGDHLLLPFAEERCAEGFDEFVGTPYEDSALYASILTPSVDSWTRNDDREVTCYLYEPGVRLEGSMQGAGR